MVFKLRRGCRLTLIRLLATPLAVLLGAARLHYCPLTRRSRSVVRPAECLQPACPWGQW